MSGHNKLLWKRKGWRDNRQIVQWNHNHSLVRYVIDEKLKSRGSIGVNEIMEETERLGHRLDRDTIWRHLKVLMRDGEIVKRHRRYGKGPKGIDMHRLSILEETISKIKDGKLLGFVQSGGLNPSEYEHIYYEMCIGERNKKRWEGLIVNIPSIISSAFRASVRRWGLKLSDMPKEVFIGYVINTRQLKKRLEKEYPTIKDF